MLCHLNEQRASLGAQSSLYSPLKAQLFVEKGRGILSSAVPTVARLWRSAETSPTFTDAFNDVIVLFLTGRKQLLNDQLLQTVAQRWAFYNVPSRSLVGEYFVSSLQSKINIFKYRSACFLFFSPGSSTKLFCPASTKI